MVEKPNRTGSPVFGCCHVRGASSAISARSVPFAGGAANSWPITEKRKRAHRSWTRELWLSVTTALLRKCRKHRRKALSADDEHLLRAGKTVMEPAFGRLL